MRAPKLDIVVLLPCPQTSSYHMQNGFVHNHLFLFQFLNYILPL